MKIEKFEIGALQTNCYLIYNNEESKVIIIDPGSDDIHLLNYIKEKNIKIEAILITHGHGDHIFGIDMLKTYQDNIKIYAGINEKEMLSDSELNLSKHFGFDGVIVNEYIPLNKNQMINILDYEIQCLSIPGHTKGGVGYYFTNEKIFFSGDSIFYHSIGRTDLPTGDSKILKQSVIETLNLLDDEVVVYPGHGRFTTVLEEKNNNPFIK